MSKTCNLISCDACWCTGVHTSDISVHTIHVCWTAAGPLGQKTIAKKKTIQLSHSSLHSLQLHRAQLRLGILHIYILYI